MISHLRRAVCGPVLVTGVLAAVSTVATVTMVTATPEMAHGGWLLTWLLLGLTAGYALSGSA